MSESNIEIAHKLYANLKEPEVLMEILSPTIDWEIAPGFPYGGKYSGIQSVFQDFFGRVLQDFEDWSTVASEIHGAGDRIVALGTYSGTAKSTGKKFVANFTHVWTMENGKMIRLQQCADTVQLERSLA